LSRIIAYLSYIELRIYYSVSIISGGGRMGSGAGSKGGIVVDMASADGSKGGIQETTTKEEIEE
jgi:hypothetical protein